MPQAQLKPTSPLEYRLARLCHIRLSLEMTENKPVPALRTHHNYPTGESGKWSRRILKEMEHGEKNEKKTGTRATVAVDLWLFTRIIEVEGDAKKN